MRIVPLASAMHLAPELARWHADEWADLLPDWDYQTALRELETHVHHNRIPMTFVALDGAYPMGSASLIVEDLPGWEHLTPWLASVFIAPNARGRGVGRHLVAHATQFAADLGFRRLHLFTAGQAEFYRPLGWTTLATSELRGRVVTVMSTELATPPGST